MTTQATMHRYCKQKAVHWPKTGTDGYGTDTYDTPTEYLVNWQDKVQSVIGQSGNEVLSRAVVFCNSDFSVDDYLYLGDLDDLSSSTVGPEDVSVSRKIIAKDKVPDRLGNQYARKYYLE